MMRNKKKKLEFRYIFLGLLVVIMLFLSVFSYTLDDKRKLNPVEVVIKDSIVTLQKIVHVPFKYVENFFGYFQSVEKLKKENQSLKEQLESVTSISAKNQELEKQVDALQSELNIEHVLTDYDYLNATVVSRNIGYWYNTITIDKGSYNGVSVNMAVINNQGLIGKVINVTNFTATIKLVTTSDISSKISVSVFSNDRILHGLIYSYEYENNLLMVEGISNSESVNIGDTVTTSGLGGIFPSGILVGTVSDITTDEYDLAKILKVKPSVEYNNINYVTVLRREVDTQ